MNAVSSLYECTVMHQRLQPKRHHFSYSVFYLWMDLDELPQWDRALGCLKYNRPALFSIYSHDHLGGKYQDLKQGVMSELMQRGIPAEQVGSIRMLAFPRVLGYIFNPVTFFFVYQPNGEVTAILIQITNTYREQKLYLATQQGSGEPIMLDTPKEFYVSPFSDLRDRFHFRFWVPAEKLQVAIDDVDEGKGKILVSRLTGTRRELSDTRLLFCAIRYPLLTLKVIVLIHWHALLLWLKRLTVRKKSAHPEYQTEVLRPHISIQKPAHE